MAILTLILTQKFPEGGVDNKGLPYEDRQGQKVTTNNCIFELCTVNEMAKLRQTCLLLLERHIHYLDRTTNTNICCSICGRQRGHIFFVNGICSQRDSDK